MTTDVSFTLNTHRTEAYFLCILCVDSALSMNAITDVVYFALITSVTEILLHMDVQTLNFSAMGFQERNGS